MIDRSNRSISVPSYCDQYSGGLAHTRCIIQQGVVVHCVVVHCVVVVVVFLVVVDPLDGWGVSSSSCGPWVSYYYYYYYTTSINNNYCCCNRIMKTTNGSIRRMSNRPCRGCYYGPTVLLPRISNSHTPTTMTTTTTHYSFAPHPTRDPSFSLNMSHTCSFSFVVVVVVGRNSEPHLVVRIITTRPTTTTGDTLYSVRPVRPIRRGIGWDISFGPRCTHFNRIVPFNSIVTTTIKKKQRPSNRYCRNPRITFGTTTSITTTS